MTEPSEITVFAYLYRNIPSLNIPVTSETDDLHRLFVHIVPKMLIQLLIALFVGFVYYRQI